MNKYQCLRCHSIRALLKCIFEAASATRFIYEQYTVMTTVNLYGGTFEKYSFSSIQCYINENTFHFFSQIQLIFINIIKS